MNEKYKQKAEGQVLGDLFSDNRTKAQKLLDECQKREKARKLVPVHFGAKTIYLVPAGTNIEIWSKNKARNLEKFQHNND
jgi:hypothetical protein